MACIFVLLCGNAGAQTSTYTVKPGDSLSKIARSQGCTVEALAKANGIKLSAVIQAGQTLKLPGKAATATPSGNGSHTVQSGDTLSSISRQYNTTVESLLAANPGLDPKTLKPGQKIQLSSVAKPPSAKPADNKTDAARKPDPARSSEGSPEKPTPTPPTLKKSQVAATETEKPVESPAAPVPEVPEEKVRTVVVDAEMTFGEFATQHGTDIKRLNELNGLDLAGATVLAKGSELYVPTRN